MYTGTSRVIFLPRKLTDDNYFRQNRIANPSRHPWGCIIRSSYGSPDVPNAATVGVVVEFLEQCSSVTGNNTCQGTVILSSCGPKLVPITCLITDCPKCTLSMEDRSSALDLLEHVCLWVTFDWDFLSVLRLQSLVQMLDSKTAESTSDTDAAVSLSTSELSKLEDEYLLRKFGSPLSILLKHFTSSPFPPKSTPIASAAKSTCIRTELLRSAAGFLQTVCWRIAQTSYTLRLMRFHLTHDEYGRRSRRSITFRWSHDEIVSIDLVARYAAISSAHFHSVCPSYGKATLTRFPSTDPTMSLLGAVQLVLLFLCLLSPLRPLHNSLSSSTLYADMDPDDDRSGETSSNIWFITDVDCTRVPTLGWFYLNSSEPDDYSNNSSCLYRHEPIVLSGPQLLRNLTFPYFSEGWFVTSNNWLEYVTCELIRLLMWLASGEPAGLKINLYLARLLGHFFLYHILAWRGYTSLMLRMTATCIGILQRWTEVCSFDEFFCANFFTSACLTLSSVYLLVQHCSGTNTIASSSTFLFAYVCTVTRLTIALFGCLLLDLINLTALHLNTFYIYAVRLLAFQTRTIVAAWRLCRNASKWNPLRGRVDTVLDMCPVERASMTRSTGRTLSNAPATITSQPPVHTSEDTHLDRLFVATLLGFAVSLCLLPTTLAFYLVFTAVRLLVTLVQQVLRSTVAFILDVPVSALLAWIVHSKWSRTELTMVTPSQVHPRFPMLHLELVRPSLSEVYKLNRLLHSCDVFGPNLPISTLITRVLTATEI